MPIVIRYKLTSARRARAPKQGELSEQSRSLPQTRRRPVGKERTAGTSLPGDKHTEAHELLLLLLRVKRRSGGSGLKSRGLQRRDAQLSRRRRSGDEPRLFSPEQFYARQLDLRLMRNTFFIGLRNNCCWG